MDLVRHAPLAARQHREAGLQVLAHRQQREDVAALRHRGDAAPRALIGRQLHQALAVPDDAAGGNRVQARDGAQQAGLADTVAAEQAGDLARLRGEGDASQRHRGAVMQRDVADFQHR
jgi:hypothetical protein